jgi:hypothetical protein
MATERLTLGATRHHWASGCHARSVERRRRLDRDTARLAAQISRLQQHHPVEIVQLAIPVEKRVYLQRRDVHLNLAC